MSTLLQDIRHAAKGLRKTPLFTAVAVGSIALGIGANTAVFTLLDQVVLRLLPVKAPHELVQVTTPPGTESYGGGMGDGSELSYAMFRDLRDHNEVFSGMLCRFPLALHVGYGGRSERVNGELVSGTFFPTLGVGAAVGRPISPADDTVASGHPVAMLGYGYWQSRFGGKPSVVGETIVVNGHPLTVIGVVDPGFEGMDIGNPVQVYAPITMEPQLGQSWLKLDDRRFRWVQVFGRLRPTLTAERAQVGLQPYFRSVLEMEAAQPAFTAATAETRRRFIETKVEVRHAGHGISGLRDSVETPLKILMGVAVGVLLIACLNVANLLLARGTARHRELALRLALGASRRRIVGLLLIESLLVAGIAGVLGLLIAQWGAAILLAFFDVGDVRLAISSGPDGRILVFTTIIAMGAAIVAGLAPALRSARLDIAPMLKGAGGAVMVEQPRLRKSLVVAQVALSFLLLAGAGLFLRSLNNLMNVELGFRPDRVLSFSMDLERSGYQPPQAHEFAKTLLTSLNGMPGVSSAGYAFFGLLNGGWGMDFTLEGRQPGPGKDFGSYCNAISPGFMKTVGIEVVAGRDFTDRDEHVRQPGDQGWPYREALVNEEFVRQYYDGQNPIGRHVGIGSDPGTKTPIEIVGVVKNAKYRQVREKDTPQIFFPYAEANEIENVTVYLRTAADPTTMMEAVRRQVAQLDRGLPIYDVHTMEERVAQSVVNERLIATLSTMFGALATVLALVGLYGVMAFTVARRTREIGIRMALGALASDVARRVLAEAGVLVAIGLVLGLGGAYWFGHYVESQLYGLTPLDLTSLVAAALTLSTVAALAAFVPARRAAHINPMSALRDE